MVYIPEEVMNRVANLKSQGKYDEAIQVVNNILMKDPTNKDALLHVADLQYLKGELDSAQKPVDFILNQTDENDPMSLYVKGVLEMEKTNWKDAKRLFKKSISLLDSDNPEIVRCLGLTEYWSGNKESGMLYLNQALELSPYDAEILINLVEITILEKDFDTAKTYISKYKDNLDKIDFYDKPQSYYDMKFGMYAQYLKEEELID